MSKSVPDFHRKDLQSEMVLFKENLLQYKNIPKSKPKNRFTDQKKINTDPFGTNEYFLKTESVQMPPKKKKLNHLQITGFKLW